MDWIKSLLLPGGNFLGIEWHVWKVIGWSGNAIFFSRFMVQWYATEKRKQVVVPTAFWWLSLMGTMLLLSYALFYTRDSVFIFAYLLRGFLTCATWSFITGIWMRTSPARNVKMSVRHTPSIATLVAKSLLRILQPERISRWIHFG